MKWKRCRKGPNSSSGGNNSGSKASNAQQKDSGEESELDLEMSDEKYVNRCENESNDSCSSIKSSEDDD